MDAGIIIKICVIMLLTSFMPLSAISFYRYRLPKKEEEYSNILKALKLEETENPLSIRNVMNEYSVIDYALPIAFATFLCFLGTTGLFLGTELKLADTSSLILSGTRFGSENKANVLYQHQSMLVLTMGFIGAYIWSVQNIFRRLVTIDLPPGAYYSVSIRIIFATLSALMIHHFLAALPIKENTVRMLPVLAFLTGMFPERAIHYLKERIRVFSDKKIRKANDLPLEMIEGINLTHKIRLSEIGIDNAQNLAKANLVELLIRCPFKARQLIDWIAQATLYIHFTKHFDKLRDIGIRDIFEFKHNCGIEGRLSEIAQSTNIPEVHLDSVYQTIKDDINVDKLYKAETNLSTI